MKRLLAGPYYLTTCPCRHWTNQRAADAGRAAIIVPVFHRIADDRANDWTTSTKVFRQAIRWLKENFDLITLDEAQRRIRSGRNERESVCVTFDDGYAVNCDTALPLLLKEGVPCTYFVTVSPVLEQKRFAHDVAMGNDFAPNTVQQLRDMAQAGIQIGAHTRTHADISQIADRRQLEDEILTARDDLEEALGSPVPYAAFPFGDYGNLSEEAFCIARDAGFRAVCSNYGGYNFPGDDPFHFQRRGVDGTLSRLKNWIHRDPFRRRSLQRYDVAAKSVLPDVPDAADASFAMELSNGP